MRTRNRTLTTTVSGQYRVDNIGNVGDPNYPIVTNTGLQTDWTLTESMTDEESGMLKYGSVTHDKTEVRYHNVELTYDYWYLDTPTPNPLGGQPRPCYRIKWSGAAMWRMYLGSSPGNTWGSPSITVPSTYDWKVLSYHAVKNMKPSLNKSGLLLLNFVSELVEACRRKAIQVKRRRDNLPKERSSRPSPKGQGSRWGAFKKAAFNRVQRVKRWFRNPDTYRDALRSASRQNLLWQFAILPTISDVKEILDRVNNLEKKIQELIRENNKIQTRHFKCPITDRITLPADIVRANVAYSSDQPGWGMREETRWMTEPFYCATMRFRYDTSALQGAIGTLRSKLSAFGVDKVVSSIWEAIPYSFVVDWFFDVGGLLESLEDYFITPLPIEVLDFVHSIKYQYVTRLIHNQGQLGTSHLKVSGILLYEKSVTKYIRRAEAPCLYSPLTIRLPSINQVLLGGSLVGAR